MTRSICMSMIVII